MGRPQSVIDWKKVDKLLESGCSGIQIAGNIGINPCTLYEHTLSEKGIPFSEYSQQKYAKGESLLKDKQQEIALKGNVSMLIWLGKQRLDQREKMEKTLSEYTEEQKKSVDALFNQIKQYHQSALDKAKSNNNNV